MDLLCSCSSLVELQECLRVLDRAASSSEQGSTDSDTAGDGPSTTDLIDNPGGLQHSVLAVNSWWHWALFAYTSRQYWGKNLCANSKSSGETGSLLFTYSLLMKMSNCIGQRQYWYIYAPNFEVISLSGVIPLWKNQNEILSARYLKKYLS